MDLIALVLAAGRGERLGGVAKALLPAPGGTFLSRIAATARAAGASQLAVVVAAPFADQVAAAARAEGAQVIVNPAPERGMGSSVAVGFAGLLATPHPRALLWPVDHPMVRVETVIAIVAPDADVVVPRHLGRGGHPVQIARALWPALAAGPEGGARTVLHDPQWRRLELEVDDAGVVRDVDQVADLPPC